MYLREEVVFAIQTMLIKVLLVTVLDTNLVDSSIVSLKISETSPYALFLLSRGNWTLFLRPSSTIP